MPYISFLTPYPHEGSVLINNGQIIVSSDFGSWPAWLHRLVEQLEEETGFCAFSRCRLRTALIRGNQEAASLVGSEVLWRCHCRVVAGVS